MASSDNPIISKVFCGKNLKRYHGFSDLFSMVSRFDNRILKLSVVAITLAAFHFVGLQARADDQATPDSDSNCYSLTNLMHDLRYGHCREFQYVKGKRGGPDTCPDLSESLNKTPQVIISDILSESSDAESFGHMMTCKYVPSFIRQGINRVQRGSGTLLHQSALACNKDQVLFLRVLGAKQVKDWKGQTPEQELSKLIEHLNLSVRLETDSSRNSEIQKHLDKCNNTMTALQQKTVSIDDLKNVSLPLESKIALVEYGKAHGTVVDEASAIIQTAGTR